MSDASAQEGSRADEWYRRGSHFAWRPSASEAPPVNIFHVEAGDPAAPPLLLVHGFPTCSVDWFEMVDRLTDRYRVCALDFPGYGFSDKPTGWGYSLVRDAELLDFYLERVVGVESAIVVAHDRGTSVSMLHALWADEGRTATRLDHLVLTNGNIYLPLSNLTPFQRQVLHPDTAPRILGFMTPELLAQGMGQQTFSPPRSADDPEVEALRETFAYADGVRVLHETIQYLTERAAHERRWLEALAAATLPTTMAWGMSDTVSPVRVATYVWTEFLMHKPGRNRLYLVPGANHYLQNDRPDALETILHHTLDAGSPSAPGPIAAEPGAPVLVDSSRADMPAVLDVLANDGSGTGS